MPGILPMKVIKIGTSAQSRIAQACDRCRSKKIRCDGITPCCSQCTNVGFDCKTSDKLSRRAFPRGYTESLEERVRSLETELRELMNLLDEKDEKIDMLSRIHSNSSVMRRPSSVFSSTPEDSAATRTVKTEDLDTDKFQVLRPRSSCDGARPEYDFRGPSSGITFVDAFKEKLLASGKPCGDFKAESFFIAKDTEVITEPGNESAAPTAMVPPRMVADQMINIFFQEWAPLFPILHRPTILKVYLDYITDSKRVLDHHSNAQLNLLFGIASSSTEWKTPNSEAFEHQWQSALNCVVQDNSLQTLQCLVLAQMYYIAKGHFDKLMHYKGLAISVSHRLGLHQDQSRFSFGTLIGEMRKRTFWTLYTLDCFSAAALGLPKMLPRDCDVQTEFPTDVDDENVSEQGFQPTLPGESTRLSSALALFRGAQILSKVLDELYPTASTHELSLHKICALSDELDTWHGTLQPHLRLQFIHEKPSTDVTGSRSPLLCLAYHYIRTLIHRPVVGSCQGVKASFAIVALAQSSKHIIQISQLLEDRRMSFSFCLNKHEVLLLAGFGLLFQTFNLDRKGHLIRDSQRLLCSIISVLEFNAAPGATDFKKIACAMISVDSFAKSLRAPNDEKRRQKSDGSISVSTGISKSAHRAQSMIVRLPASRDLPLKQEAGIDRRSTAPDLSTGHSDHHYNFAPIGSDAVHSSRRSQTSEAFFPKSTTAMPNLDFLDFSHEAKPASLHGSTKSANGGPNMELSQNDNHENVQVVQTPLDSLFPAQDPFSYISSSASNNALDWCGGDSWTELAQPTQSVLSEEELTSGEELSSCDMEGHVSNGLSSYQGHNKQELGDMDGSFGLYEDDGDLNFGQKSETD